MCYLTHTAVIEEAESLLQRVLLAMVAGNRNGVSRAEVTEFLRTRFNLPLDEFSVHLHHQEEFLIRFSSEEARAHVTNGNVRSPRCRLILHPWSSLAGTEPVSLLFHVDMEIRGIPDHAWHISSAYTLLAPFCLIENLAPETRDASDMSVFRLSAWTVNPDGIPRSSELLLPAKDTVILDANPAKAERLAVRLLRWPVSIHVMHSADYRRPSPPLPPPSGTEGDRGSPPSPSLAASS